jgi:hypothetical protein
MLAFTQTGGVLEEIALKEKWAEAGENNRRLKKLQEAEENNRRLKKTTGG